MNGKPNFLVIGAQKSGTTSIYNYLRQHPQIYMSPIKETHFFTYEGQYRPEKTTITTFDDYLELFSSVRDERAIGECSPSYLHSGQAPERIYHYLPSIKLIAILRNPVDRAFSNWMHNVSRRRESLNFTDAVLVEQDRIRKGAEYEYWYIQKGFYHRHLSRYYGYFTNEMISVYLFDNLIKNSKGLIRDIYSFLDVDTEFHPRVEAHNVSGVPRGLPGIVFNALRKNHLAVSVGKAVIPEVIRRWARSLLLARPEIKQELRQALIETYREDILRLQGLIGRDLTVWLR